MAEFTGFIGPSYRSQANYAAVERCVNFYPEVIEDRGETKARMVLYPTPCTGVYSANSPDATNPESAEFVGRSRGLIQINGELYGVNGTRFFRFFPPTMINPLGSWVGFGDVEDDGNPVTLIANGVINPGDQQLFIVSAKKGYIFKTQSGQFIPLDAGSGFIGGMGGTFLDSYFCSIIPGTNGFQVSNQNDGTSWISLGIQAIAYTQGQSDTLVNLIANGEYLYIFGSRRSEIWYNSGGQFFPFSIQPGAFIEMGLGATYALIQADNSIFFLGQDQRGGRSAWRLNGLTPIRVSNYAVEWAWSQYSTIDDCITYSFLWKGHIFVRFIFPTADAGWTYDCTASQQLGYAVWHENTFTDSNGLQHAPIERTHAYFNGVHVVGSGGAEGFAGTLYQFTDVTKVDEDPVLLLRYSNDGGNIFLDEEAIRVGKAGEFNTRCIKDMSGSARDRVYWVRCVDYGDAGGTNPITRDRICPHIFGENRRVFYHRLEIEVQKAIGAQDGTVLGFWALINAYLEFESGLN